MLKSRHGNGRKEPDLTGGTDRTTDWEDEDLAEGIHRLSSRRWHLRRHPYVACVLANISQEGRLLAALPVGGALVLVVVGLLLTLRALSQPDLLGV